MARKRMLDPGIWTNEQVARLSVLQRLLYIGLISNADDEGRLNGNPTYIKGVIFPHDNITVNAIEDALRRISKEALISRYKVGKSWYIQHPNWKLYQTINRPTPSRIPPKSSMSPHGVLSESSVSPHDQQKTTTIEEKGIEQKGKSPFTKSLELLLSVGVVRNKAIILSQAHPYAKILSIYEVAKSKDNPAGFIISALERNWTVDGAVRDSTATVPK